MERAQKVQITIRKTEKHFALEVEDQLVALVVHRKDAVVLDNLLRGCIKYSSRNLFREVLKDALVAGEKPEETPVPEKPKKATKAKGDSQKAKAKGKGKIDAEAATPTDAPADPVADGSVEATLA